MNRLALVCLAALAAAAASWATPGPIVTRGSAALPDGCGPAVVAGIAATRAAQDQRDLVFSAAVPTRSLADPNEVAVDAGLTASGSSYSVAAVVDCAKGDVVAWNEKRVPPFSSPGQCPEPKGWKSGTVVACAGLPSAWETSSDFTVKTTQLTSGPCGADSARRRIYALLHALDYAHAYPFALNFTAAGRYLPYTASLTKARIGRLRISVYAAARMAAVDGWTATSLLGPLDHLQKTATYRVGLVSYLNGDAYGAGYAQMVLDCRSGLIASWTGPALPLPLP